ncbi:MAG: PDZ domain-containing protein [Fimbriimonas ginsengisoli]|nr:PDZ domain-containing protein [Fimbriimonas ginsengisoli]
MSGALEFVLNGRPVRVEGTSPNTTLLEFLRGNGLTGSKEGCAEGDCGACSVVIVERDANGKPTYRSINSCLVPVCLMAGREIVSVEGVGCLGAPKSDEGGAANLHPVQRKMVEHFGSQCGYCTPGFICSLFEGYYRDDAVSFDLNGKYLYLVSARTFNPVGGDFEFNALTQGAQRVYLLTLAKDTPNPLAPTSDEETDKPAAPAGPGKGEGKPGEGPKETKIDLDGLGGRIVALPMPAGGYGFIVGGNNGVFYLGASGLSKFDLTSKESSVIMAGGRLFDFNPARTKLAYVAAGTLGISDIHPGIKPGDGKVETSGVEAVVDPKAEWKQMFWEAWRWERDHFYDKAMTGLDWKAIGDRYAKYLPYVSHRSDLTYVLGLMLGELGTSHAYVFGGDLGPMIPPVVVGMLGADYGLDSGHVKFKKIYRGESFEEGRRGPLGEPGINVNEGDYLLEIDGKEVAPSVAPQSLLLDKAGHQVTLTVNSVPSTTGARKVVVRPIASEGQLRYIDWVEATRRKVGELSGGKIGYMHVPDTSIDGVIEFLKGFYSQTDKEAMIVDERWNGGGMIPTFYIEKLSRHTMTVFRQRHGDDVPFPVQHLEGPKVMLINAYAGSGGDLFPWFFRQAKLGPLIGKRTWGGLVGITGGAPLVDGGTVTAPEFGLYDPATGKWIAENMGIDPDIDVDLRPDLAAQGRDPQLEKAVEVLMDELKKGKAPVRRPDFPKVGP